MLTSHKGLALKKWGMEEGQTYRARGGEVEGGRNGSGNTEREEEKEGRREDLASKGARVYIAH